MQLPDLKGVRNASENLQGVSVLTPLVINERLSNDLNCKIYLKREDLQQVRSFKIRGAFNKIRSIDSDYLKNKTLVCASAGNHAQGFAYSCNKLKIYGKIYMPVTTPKQKIERVKIFGGEYVEIILIGDNFDDAQYEAQKQNTDKDLFVHAFDDVNVIEGQGTIGLEILDQVDKHFDYLIVPVGGGGLISGIITVFKELSPKTKIIGVEAEGAPAMSKSLKDGKIIKLDSIDNFVDGVSIKKIGKIPFDICKKYLDEIYNKIYSDGRVWIHAHFGSNDIDEIFSKIRFMIIGCDCKWVVVDHLHMLVSATTEGDERRTIDSIMTKLRSIVEETGAGMILVSHLRRVEGNRGHENGVTVGLNHLRGSQSIAQLSDCVIALERNQQSDDPIDSQTTHMRILKSRYTGDVGMAAHLLYDQDTGRLKELDAADFEDDGVEL